MSARRRLGFGGAALALAAGFAMPGALPVHAAGTGCSGTLSSAVPPREVSCSFVVQSSSSLSVYLSTWQALGSSTGDVAAVLLLTDPAGNVLAYCYEVTGGACSGGSYSNGDQVPPGTVLTCTVDGVENGTFGCSSS